MCLYAAPRYTTRRLILKGNTDLSLLAARRVRFNPLWLDIALPLSRCLGNGDSCELAMEIRFDEITVWVSVDLDLK